MTMKTRNFPAKKRARQLTAQGIFYGLTRETAIEQAQLIRTKKDRSSPITGGKYK